MHPQLIGLVLPLISWPVCSCALELCVVCLCPVQLAPVLFYCWASRMGPQTCIVGSLVSRMDFRHVLQVAPSLAVPKWTFWWTLHLTCSLALCQCREAATVWPCLGTTGLCPDWWGHRPACAAVTHGFYGFWLISSCGTASLLLLPDISSQTQLSNKSEQGPGAKQRSRNNSFSEKQEENSCTNYFLYPAQIIFFLFCDKFVLWDSSVRFFPPFSVKLLFTEDPEHRCPDISR